MRGRRGLAGDGPAAAARRSLLGVGLAAGLAGFLGLAGCSSGDNSGGGGGPVQGGNAVLQKVRYGRLADVYGLRTSSQGTTVDLVEVDVMIGGDIQDERPSNSNKRDEEILYDFLSANPDTLQPRLLITREIGSAEFDAAFAALARRLTEVTPGLFGQNITQRPFTVVPRNAAIELEFSQDLGIDEDFFLARDAGGEIIGVRNAEAVQLLQIVGDPWDADARGDFRQIQSRIIPRGDRLILDPVLLGIEGAQYQVRNNASGLPESPDQLGANIRIAVAIDGPLRIPGISEAGNAAYLGTNNQGERSVVRDFRSGNSDDNSADLARGFVRDTDSPRVIGQMPMFVASVEPVGDGTQVVRLYKNGRIHQVDRGDVVRFIDPATEQTLGSSEVVAEPDDAGDPGKQIVRLLVRDIEGLAGLDPRGLAGFPGLNDPGLPQWLRANAAKAVLIAEFTAQQTTNSTIVRDDPVNFFTLSPTPLPLANGDPSPLNQNVSPFAEAIIRFTKPVDMTTVSPYDSFFFATRNVVDDQRILTEFIQPRQIDPDRFNKDKFMTPHLVVARVIDEDGSQTSIRLQPTKGFFLNEEMRMIDEGQNFEDKRFKYFLHVLGGQTGVRDLAGNPVDFQATSEVTDYLVVPFSLDTRRDQNNQPLYADNLVVNVVRRFADFDEDPKPSLYRDNEVAKVDAGGQPLEPPIEAIAEPDLFGAVTYLSDGRLQARTTSRVTKVVDDINQQPPPPSGTLLQFCPDSLSGAATVATATASVRFGQGIQNPLNPFGARLQTVWREIDMSLSRLDPLDFNLDVEQMYWAPFTADPITYDEFDRVSLFLGHSEFRPEPCIGTVSSLPELTQSGLNSDFADNYAHNKAIGSGAKTDNPPPHPAYVDQRLVIDPALAFTELNGVNRYLPLPTFEKPYFVWRDETSPLQGGNSMRGSDVGTSGQNNLTPYIPSPWLGGAGRFVTRAGTPPATVPVNGYLYNVNNYQLGTGLSSSLDTFTGGLVPAIGLPLLADFWTYCDDPDLPAGNGFVATGYNGWQISLTVQSSPQPNFRAYSGGFSGAGSRPPICRTTSDQQWARAAGGYTQAGGTTPGLDNSMYWIMADFLKRQSVATAGFVDVFNPHRMPARVLGEDDPRLGPYLVDAGGNSVLPPGMLPQYDWSFDPPLETLPGGTAVIPEFRAATVLDPQPFAYAAYSGSLGWVQNNVPPPDEDNFPLDPLKAGDAHIRKYDNRTVNGARREWWTHFYNRSVTEYTRDVTDLANDDFTGRFAGPNASFTARDVRYFNWRFIMRNNADANPPVSPAIGAFGLTFRFEQLQ